MTFVMLMDLLGYIVLAGMGVFLLAVLTIVLYIAFYDTFQDARIAFSRKFRSNRS